MYLENQNRLEAYLYRLQNMAFRKRPLLAIGGIDHRFRMAGDDLDVCWRIQEHGGWLAFSPGAMVWYHRRYSIRAYMRQQSAGR